MLDVNNIAPCTSIHNQFVQHYLRLNHSRLTLSVMWMFPIQMPLPNTQKCRRIERECAAMRWDDGLTWTACVLSVRMLVVNWSRKTGMASKKELRRRPRQICFCCPLSRFTVVYFLFIYSCFVCCKRVSPFFVILTHLSSDSARYVMLP